MLDAVIADEITQQNVLCKGTKGAAFNLKAALTPLRSLLCLLVEETQCVCMCMGAPDGKDVLALASKTKDELVADANVVCVRAFAYMYEYRNRNSSCCACAQMLDVLTQPLDSGKREVVVVESSKAISHTWKKEEDDDDEEIIAKPAAPKRGNKGGTNNSKKTAAPAMHFEVQETPAKFAKPCAGFDVFCGSAERMYEQGVGDELDKFMVRVSWYVYC